MNQSPDTPEAGLTLIDLACIFAVASVVGWNVVPYFLAIGGAVAVLIGCLAAVLGLVRLVPFLLRSRQAHEVR